MTKAIYDVRHAAICGALLAARKSKELSLIQVSDILKQKGKTFLTAEAIGLIEKGQRKIDIVEFVDLANAISVTWLRLLPEQIRESM